MRGEIARLHRNLKTNMIYVTHDQVEAMTLGDRIIVMKDGVIQQVGAPLEVYDRPANRCVASFIGAPEMNFVDGAIEAADGHCGRSAQDCGYGSLPSDRARFGRAVA